LAAYNRKNGALRWAVCASKNLRRDVLSATDKLVYLVEYPTTTPGSPTVTAYDVETGKAAPSATLPSTPLRTGPFEGVVVDGVRISGGQDDPTSAVDESTGKTLWTKPGSPPYDDVWAIGDNAVFVIDRGATAALIGYELKTGATRWQLSGIQPYGAAMGWPWHVDGKDLFAIWSDLAVISTRDGKTRWHTSYPVAEFPRMTGVRANAALVFVAFSSVPSGGD
jgi:outer membrane protein assembly factor BamB